MTHKITFVDLTDEHFALLADWLNQPHIAKFYGCIVGCHVGSAMGAPVECWPYERIQEKYGTLTKLLPYEHYNS